MRNILVMARSGVQLAVGGVTVGALLLQGLGFAGAGGVTSDIGGQPSPKYLQAAEAAGGELVEGLTTRESTTYLETDNTYHTQISSAPINFRDDSGAWQAIDNTLVESPGQAYATENAANEYLARLPADASDTPIRFQSDGDWIASKMLGADGPPVIDGTEATYSDVPQASSVTYETTPTSLKESITLAAAPLGAPQYRFALSMALGLLPKVTATGGIDIVDEDSGVIVFQLPPPFMFDSTESDPSYSDSVSYELIPDSTGWKMTVTPDFLWLTDPSRVYPVVIDPTISVRGASTDCGLNGAQPTNNSCGSPYLKVGSDSHANSRRALLRFNVSAIPRGAVIENATLGLNLDSTLTSRVAQAVYDLHVPRNQWTNQVTWSSPDGTPTSSWVGGSPEPGVLSTNELNGSTSGYKSFAATDAVDGWINRDEPNQGLLLKQSSESVDSVLSFTASAAVDEQAKWPRLTVEYIDITKSKSLEGDRALWEAALQCMVASGEVDPTATVSQVFGEVRVDGTFVPPTASPEVIPSPACVHGAVDLVLDTLAQVPEGQSPDGALIELQEDLRSGVVATPQGDQSPLVIPPDPDGVTPDSRCSMPGVDTFIASLNYYADMPMGVWGQHSIGQYWCIFRWDDDSCTGAPESTYWYDFTWPCKRHDFGYRNLQKAEGHYGPDIWRERNKRVADTQFRRDMYTHCASRTFYQRPLCWNSAASYYFGVCNYGWKTCNEWEYSYIK